LNYDVVEEVRLRPFGRAVGIEEIHQLLNDLIAHAPGCELHPARPASPNLLHVREEAVPAVVLPDCEEESAAQAQLDAGNYDKPVGRAQGPKDVAFPDLFSPSNLVYAQIN